MPTRNVLTFECVKCHERFNEEERMATPDGEDICHDCFDEHYRVCDDCGRTEHIDDTTYAGSRRVCDNCFDENYFECGHCGDYFHNDDRNSGDDTYLCNSCYEDWRGEMGSVDRGYSKGDEYCEGKGRPFSCEIECYFPDYDVLQDVADALPREIGIHHDGSLNDNGKEFVTPKLSGKSGNALLKDLCTTLTKKGFTVDKQCGLHIHLEASDVRQKLSRLQLLMTFYMVFEPVIFSFLPLSRRSNRYCLPLTDFYHQKEIENCGSIEKLEMIWYREQNYEEIKRYKREKYHNSRYAGINLHSLFSHGHLEIRYHSGTIDYTKIRMWIDLHLAILKLITEDRLNWNDVNEAKYLVGIEEKQKIFFKLLELPEVVEKYFIDRQKKFGLVTEENKNICAE